MDGLLILSERHLQQVLAEFLKYYNERRPHQGIGQQIPMLPVPLTPQKQKPTATGGGVQGREVLGGIIHDYYREDCQAA